MTATPKATQPLQAVIYARISKDRRGDELGVKRQEKTCRELAEARGYDVAQVLIDNDISASTGRRRPAYEELIAGMEAGTWDCVLAWDPDRVHRTPKELERFIDAASVNSTPLVTVEAGRVDLSTPAGRAVARTLVAWARYETEHGADRQRAKVAEVARAGLPHGGPRPYGFEPDKVTARPAEAAVVLEAFQRAKVGESLNNIAADLNERGIVSATGNAWAPPLLQRLLVSPRVAGLRQHRTTRQRAGRTSDALEAEVLHEAVWPALVPRDEWQRLRLVLLSPDRARSKPATRSLLAGLLRCDQCGKLLAAHSLRKQPVYACIGQYRVGGPDFVRPEDRQGCGGRRAPRDVADDYVAAEALGRLAVPGNRARLAAMADAGEADTDETLASIAADEQQLRDLAESYAAGALPLIVLQTAAAAIEARLRQARSQVTRAALVAGLPPTSDAAQMASWWAEAGLPSRRAMLEAVISHVVLLPNPVARQRGFDPRVRLKIVLR